MMKDFDIEEMKDGVREARRALEQKREELREQVERSDAMLTVLDGVDEGSRGERTAQDGA